MARIKAENATRGEDNAGRATVRATRSAQHQRGQGGERKAENSSADGRGEYNAADAVTTRATEPWYGACRG